MKLLALSLWQPWAQLIADGTPDGRRKTIETRVWGPRLRTFAASIAGSRLAIHAAARRVPWRDWPVFDYRRRPLNIHPKDCIYGGVVAVATLAAARELTDADADDALCACDGKFGLILTDVRRVFPAVRCPGRQGFFYVEIPDAS